ncbi:MAG: hypothetical protein FWB96_09900 [Defluviitaleaceae bacterium]|nr:hypothetical protein [Defluviitaleaceae bacterium]MCL2263168.1 hypothetical protein [Defluviitaleaceae bacterium]
MNLLPNYENAVIPIEKFTEYALDSEVQEDKATAFDRPLGYNRDNADSLIANIRQGLSKFSATAKGDSGHGMRYEVIMTLTGPNGKTANVLTAWIFDKRKNEMRLTSAYVDKKRGY